MLYSKCSHINDIRPIQIVLKKVIQTINNIMWHLMGYMLNSFSYSISIACVPVSSPIAFTIDKDIYCVDGYIMYLIIKMHSIVFSKCQHIEIAVFRYFKWNYVITPNILIEAFLYFLNIYLSLQGLILTAIIFICFLFQGILNGNIHFRSTQFSVDSNAVKIILVNIFKKSKYLNVPTCTSCTLPWLFFFIYVGKLPSTGHPLGPSKSKSVFSGIIPQ